MEKMSLHKALGELKILDDRIDNKINSGVFITVNKHSNKKISGMSLEEYEKRIIKSSYNSVNDLINRRKKIKTALTIANASIQFELNGEKFTIATAIDRKNTLFNEKMFLQTLESQYSNAIRAYNTVNDNLADEALRQAQKFFENKDNVDTNKIKTLQQDYIDHRKLDLVDPLNLKAKIGSLRESIENFERDIDYKLSELNATNFIEID